MSEENNGKLGMTAFVIAYLKDRKGLTSGQICDAYSEHLGHRCNHANMTVRLKTLADRGRILREGASGHYLYSGVSARWPRSLGSSLRPGSYRAMVLRMQKRTNSVRLSKSPDTM